MLAQSRCLRRLEASQVLIYQPDADLPIHRLGRRNVSVDTSKGHPAMDYEAHKKTYENFLRFTKFGIIFLVILLAGMKIFLV
jgi:hypothetical protein